MNLFIKHSYTVNNVKWPIIECRFEQNSESIIHAWNQAQQKSIFTMNSSQSGHQRSQELKLNKQFMGILGEIGCQKYLEKVLFNNNLLDEWNVVRYDDVRTDKFRSPVNEFDLKIQNKNNNEKFVLIESRSSITYDRSLQEGLSQYDIIGPYSSDNKFKEGRNDLYLRPLFEWTNFEFGNYDGRLFKNYTDSGLIKLYIVAGCTFSDIMGNKGIVKSMGQGNTIYNALPIKLSTNPIQFQNAIKMTLDKIK
jgi:hypothetical protein